MSVKKPKILLVTGNEEPRNINFFLENFLYHKKLKEENPLLIYLANNNCFMPVQSAPNEEKNSNPVGLYTDMSVPAIKFENLVAEINKRKNTDFVTGEVGYSEFIFSGQFNDDNLHLYRCVDYTILILKSSFESSSYLFNFINKLNNKNIDGRYWIIISGLNRIDEAAACFLTLRKEMQELICNHLALDFLGFLTLDLNKVVISRRRKGIYLKSFFEDSYHGQIKYINEKIFDFPYREKQKTFFEELEGLILKEGKK